MSTANTLYCCDVGDGTSQQERRKKSTQNLSSNNCSSSVQTTRSEMSELESHRSQHETKAKYGETTDQTSNVSPPNLPTTSSEGNSFANSATSSFSPLKANSCRNRKLRESVLHSKKGRRTSKILLQLTEIKRNGSQCVNDFYLQSVGSRSIKDVEAIFNSCDIEPSLNLERNCVNEHEKTALRLAIENKDLAMCQLLLNNQVNVGNDLFYAIERNFVPGVEAILKHDPCTEHRIDDHHHFEIGLTPMLLAAHCNNYDILRLLYQNHHRLQESMKWSEGIHLAIESATNRMMMTKAKASPAYINLICEMETKDPMKYCIDLMKDLRRRAITEHELRTFYKNLQVQMEEYMCNLLDQVQTSKELAELYQYDFAQYSDAKAAFQAFGEIPINERMASCRMELLEKACNQNLVKFVTHRNSQLAISYLKYRYTTFLKDKDSPRRAVVYKLVGFLFPLCCIFHIFAPWCKVGGLMTLPNVAYECHLASDLIFMAMLIANVVTKSVDFEYLGAPPRTLEWFIFVWILGKWKKEIEEVFRRGFKKYIHDWWNYTDIVELVLFAVVIILRIVDYATHHSDPHPIYRSNWSSDEPRLIASGLLAWSYVFVFMRALSLTRTSQILGPLQISLAKIIVNVLQFLCIFSLVIFAFALSLSELFWYYGTTSGEAMLCNVTENSSSVNCKFKLFVNLGISLRDLFWALFGYFEPDITLDGKHDFIEWNGRLLAGLYHVIAIVILINMLIAMMARSYEVTSENKDTEWKFLRTVVWLRFIRREVSLPPPMNLFPNLYSTWQFVKCIVKKLARCCGKGPREAENEMALQAMTPTYSSASRHAGRLETLTENVQSSFRVNEVRPPRTSQAKTNDLEIGNNYYPESPASSSRKCIKRQISMQMTSKMVQRYKFKKLLNTVSLTVSLANT